MDYQAVEEDEENEENEEEDEGEEEDEKYEVIPEWVKITKGRFDRK